MTPTSSTIRGLLPAALRWIPFATCLGQIAMLTAYVLGLVILFKSRGIVTAALFGRESRPAVEPPPGLR